MTAEGTRSMTTTPTGALAAALHDCDDTCNANQYVPFEECATKEWDEQHAAEVVEALRTDGWILVRDPAGTLPLDAALGELEQEPKP